MKTNTLSMLGTLALVGAALWMLQRRGVTFANPPASKQYHAKNNPNGYTWVPGPTSGGGAWTRVTPEGVPEYWADVL